MLVIVDSGVGCLNRMAASRNLGADTAPEIRQIVDTGGDSRDAFVVERTPFPAIGNRIRKRTNLVRTQARQMWAFAEEHAHVRPKKLVGRANKKIAIERGYVN